MRSADWNKITSKQIEILRKAAPVFIGGSRAISSTRIAELTNSQLRKSPLLIWGKLKDNYIPGLEQGLAFATLSKKTLNQGLAKANLPKSEAAKILRLDYYQRDLPHIVKAVKPRETVLVYGSWSRALHFRPEYWELDALGQKPKLVSGYESETEARAAAKLIDIEFTEFKSRVSSNASSKPGSELIEIAQRAARFSCDWSFQVGAVVAKRGKPIGIGYNTVLPYQTANLHHGLRKEKYHSPPGDQNNYDTNHAEVEAILAASNKGISVKNASIFVTVAPCETCARMLARSGITKVVVGKDHSNSSGIEILAAAGISIDSH